MKLTSEQEKIISAVKNGEPLIKINAFAGTGKTTTLLSIAKEFPFRRILYLAFNKSIQMEAMQKFPKNVTVKTTHSLAYSNIMKLGYSAEDIRGEYKVKEIADMFYLDDYEIARLSQKFFLNFCNSANKEIIIDDTSDDYRTQEAKRIAKNIFNRMLAKKMPFTHSFYLKLFQLMLEQGEVDLRPYQLILLDEAQDTNDVTLSIFYNLPAKQKVIVGDKHQQIYSFRGSVNAMQKVKASTYYLTRSFRFTQKIANKTTKYLHLFKGEEKRLEGVEKSTEQTEIKITAHITRTNATLIRIISELVEENKFFKTIREPYSIFGLSLNILNLMEGKELDHQYQYLYSLYQDFKKRDEYDFFLHYLQDVSINELDDLELYMSSKVILEFKKYIRSLYQISKTNYNSQEKCSIYLTTAHTAKGLEFDKVVIYEDFDPISAIASYLSDKKILKKERPIDYMDYFVSNLKKNKIDQRYVDELNLYYVCVTRAKYLVVDYTGIFDDIESMSNVHINHKIEKLLLKD